MFAMALPDCVLVFHDVHQVALSCLMTFIVLLIIIIIFVYLWSTEHTNREMVKCIRKS